MHAARGEANFWNNACSLTLPVVFLRVPPLRRSVDKSRAWTMENGRNESTETMRVCLLLQRYTWVKLVVRLELPRGLVVRSRDPAAYFIGPLVMTLLLEKFDAAETANPRAMLFLCHLVLRFMDVSRVCCNICCPSYNGRRCRMIKIIYILIDMIFQTCTYCLYFCVFKLKCWNISISIRRIAATWSSDHLHIRAS